MDNRKLFGKVGEWVACICYLLMFYRILCRNFRTKVGEIDIICVRLRTLVCVEVKARRNYDYDDIIYKRQQMQRMQKVLQIFLQRNNQYYGYDIRFDLVVVSCGALRIYKNISL